MRRTLLLFLVLSFLSIAFLPGALHAQRYSTDTLLGVFEFRAEDEVQKELDEMKALELTARNSLDVRKVELSLAKARIERKEEEIDDLEEKLDLAQDEKREKDEEVIAAELDAAQAFQDILELHAELRGAQAELALAEVEYAKASQKALQLEQEQLKRRKESGANATVAARQDKTLIGIESRLLDARISRYAKKISLAEREETVAEKLKEVFQAQGEVKGRQ